MSTKLESFVDSLVCENSDREYYEKYKALASFLNEIDFEKSEMNMTQRALAEKCELTKSMMSRLLSLKSNLNYEQMNTLVKGVGGQLMITAYGDCSVTVPRDLREMANEIADKKKISMREYLLEAVREKIIYDAEKYIREEL